MPLAVLLENLAGVYVSLWAGADTVLPGLKAVGLGGAVTFDARIMLDLVNKCRPSTLIVTPQVLQAMIEVIHHHPYPDSLRFIALGGAPVSRSLLDKAASLKLPVYEGYGLSECASVTTLNTPGNNRPGSVGKPLPHIKVTVSNDGEVLIQSSACSGYLGQQNITHDQIWHTGDLGYLDKEGYLYLTGRKRNVFITAMGRNVSPEWVERELVLAPEILQVAVFGEAQPRNVAVIVTRPGISSETIRQVIKAANQSLPDYARVSDFIIAAEPFSPANQQLSGTGRNRRENIYRAYATKIENIFVQEPLYE
jgi:long-subunit acyl-CoA synthetase (AMP-forming)